MLLLFFLFLFLVSRRSFTLVADYLVILVKYIIIIITTVSLIMNDVFNRVRCHFIELGRLLRHVSPLSLLDCWLCLSPAIQQGLVKFFDEVLFVRIVGHVDVFIVELFTFWLCVVVQLSTPDISPVRHGCGVVKPHPLRVSVLQLTKQKKTGNDISLLVETASMSSCFLHTNNVQAPSSSSNSSIKQS